MMNVKIRDAEFFVVVYRLVVVVNDKQPAASSKNYNFCAVCVSQETKIMHFKFLVR